MTIYTVIGYREDYFYDSWSDRSSSDIDFQIFDSSEQAIQQIFEFRTRTERQHGPNARGYENWQPTLLIDGMDEDWWLDEYRDTGLENPFYPITDAAWKLYEAWQKEAKDRETAKRKAEEAQEKKRAAAAAKSEVAKEKALLKKLRDKYPDEAN